MSITFFFILFSLFFTNTTELDCTDITGNPIQPIGCDIINGDVGLVVPNYTQQELQKFSDIQQINGNLRVGYYNGEEYVHNPNLKTLEGFNALQILNGDLECWYTVLESFLGLQNVTNISGTVNIQQNSNLSSFLGLNSVQNIGTALLIVRNSKLTNLFEMNSIQNVSGNIIIENNPVLTSLWRVNSLQNIGQELLFSGNSNLMSLTGLSSVQNIGQHFLISVSDCDNVCNRNIIHRLKNISPNVRFDQCEIDSFICVSNTNTIEQQINNCTYDSQCEICNETDCNFETIYKGCGDGIIDSENGENCDNKSDPLCINCISPTFSLISTSKVPSTSTSSQSNSESTSVILVSNFGSNSVTESEKETLVRFTFSLPYFNYKSNFSIFKKNSDINGFDCGLQFCEISDVDGITVFTVDTLDLDSNLAIFNNQQLIITSGNLTLNGFNLSLSSKSSIQIENGCLDAKHSTLHLNLTDVEITPKKTTVELIEYDCITNEFEKIETTSSLGICLAVEEVYSATYYSVLVSEDSHCVSDSFRYTIYQSYYLIILLVIITVF